MKRVVITGVGSVNPLGVGVAESWAALCSGKSGVGPITRFDASQLPVKIAGAVPFKNLDSGDACTEVEHVFSARDQKRMDVFSLFGMCATQEALADAGWLTPSDAGKERTSVIIGAGLPGVTGIESEVKKLQEGGRASPLFLPKILGNLLSGAIGMRYGFHGRNVMVVAGSSGTCAIGAAYNAIRFGESDCAVAGGVDGTLCRVAVAGFSAMQAMATSYNDRPTEASRPWDRAREGFVMSEGAGVVFLEEREHAIRRGVHIYAEIAGVSSLQDNADLVCPQPCGLVGSECMRRALSEASMNPEDVGYVAGHSSSTVKGDAAEANALKEVFGSAIQNIPVTSFKGALGDLMGAAGAVDVICALKGLQYGLIPATLNTTDVCEEAEGIDIVCGKTREKDVRSALAYSVGLGCTHTSIILTKG